MHIISLKIPSSVAIAVVFLFALVVGVGVWVFSNQEVFTPNEITVPAGHVRERPEDETANWKTYANNDYGFEFKYPQTFFLEGQLIDLGNGLYGFDKQTDQLNSDVSPSAIHLYVNFAEFLSLVDNKETCIDNICSRKGPIEDQRIINQAPVGDEIETNSGLPGKVVSIGGVNGFRYLGYNPQAKAYNTGVVVYNSQVDRIELSMSIAAPDETQAENDKLNKDFNQIISTFKFTK